VRAISTFRVIRDGIELGKVSAEKEELAWDLAKELHGRGISLEKHGSMIPFAASDIEIPEEAMKALDSLNELDYCNALDSTPADDTILAAAKRRARALIGKD
jgi:hypothetical protein